MKKLLDIQVELKAPKSQFNSFGKYNYRSAEDILEAVKPLCKKHDATLTITDEIIMVGERYYVKATARLISDDGEVSTTAYAREDENKKGMDGSQITGAASSYARKYALNGLFCIDDTKDADTDEHKNNQQERKDPEEVPEFVATLDAEKELTEKWIAAGYSKEKLAPFFEKRHGVSIAKAPEFLIRKAIADMDAKAK